MPIDETSPNGWAVTGRTNTGTGVVGLADQGGVGVYGESTSGYGYALHGKSEIAPAVKGDSTNHIAVLGRGYSGVYGESTGGTAVIGVSGASGRSGLFSGRVDVSGDLTVMNGNIAFKIDHPSDPQNKYLLHHCVESSERKNIYEGVAQLNEDGEASVDLPEWLEALNEDFRYQLTAVGGAAPNLHVAEEISENRFKIAGGEGGMKVCWQVTGTRKDPWAAANPFVVEEEKPQEERGRFLQPNLFDAPEEQRVMMGLPMEEEGLRQMREAPPQPPQVPLPTSFEPPRAPAMLPGAPAMPPGIAAPGFFGRLEEGNRRQIDELRGQIEELRRRL
jgi:hypothetical protein